MTDQSLREAVALGGGGAGWRGRSGAAGAGFGGALGTYPTLSLAAVNLAAATAWHYASINVASMLVAGLMAVWLAWFWSS